MARIGTVTQIPAELDDPSATIEDTIARAGNVLRVAQRGLRILHDEDSRGWTDGMQILTVFGRSVTFVLQNLRHKAPDFEAWYQPRQREMSEDPLLRYFSNARNMTLKRGMIPGLRFEQATDIFTLTQNGRTTEWARYKSAVVDPCPESHRGKPITDPSIQALAVQYYEYLALLRFDAMDQFLNSKD